MDVESVHEQEHCLAPVWLAGVAGRQPGSKWVPVSCASSRSSSFWKGLCWEVDELKKMHLSFWAVLICLDEFYSSA